MIKSIIIIKILSAMILSIILQGSKCGNDDPPPIRQAGIYDVRRIGSAPEGYCAERYTFSFSDSVAGSRYYWIGIEKNGRLFAYGDGKFMTAPFYNQTHYIDVNYTHGFSPWDSFNIYIYAAIYETDIGDLTNANGSGGPVVIGSIATWDPYMCKYTCCTRPADAGARYYAQVYKDISGLIGASARMKARFGQLCGQSSGGTDTAFSVAWSGISYEAVSGNVVWVQIGYGINRNQFEHIPSYTPFAYGEVNPEFGDPEYTFLLRSDWNDSIDDYHFQLNPSNGKIIFSLNGTPWDTLQHPDWTRTGERIWWGAEILNYEDDMAGTNANRCVMSYCKYYDGSWHNANFISSGCFLRRSDEDEWQIYVYDNITLHIWDKNPQ
jgi:hypothetical protein